MISLKNISKTYTPKRGVPVHALDNVSVDFEETGMVFILGKSGSGKSTLLNVIGGLDTYDEGELIIKGKSSERFSQANFDSYRNTFIGFIFQEYNILENFSVGANIALAMELQGKKPTPENLNKILEMVDLEGHGNRKPNELSGGQKQRVAIARALIKEPEIIVADEPTGALDSKTGAQVFETLKKLSANKLVLIVSHDRDYAERYADRIIELADGKIISDVSNVASVTSAELKDISVVEDRFIWVREGYKLSEEDLTLINNYLAKANNDTIISLDKNANDDIRKYANFASATSMKDFKDTKTKLKTYDPNEFKLIKSHLPIDKASKIGASGLKLKPFRLCMTILLSFVAFGLFGLADTLGSYEKVTNTVQSIVDSEIRYASFTKSTKQVSSYDDYEYYSTSRLSKNDLKKIKEETGIDCKPIVTSDWYGSTLNENFSLPSAISNNYSYPYYSNSFSGYFSITQAEIDEYGYTLEGRLPQSDDEIVITKHIYESFKFAGYHLAATDEREAITIEPDDLTPESLIGKKITNPLSDPYSGDSTEHLCEIVGILDTKLNSARYTSLIPPKEEENNQINSGSANIGNYIIQSEFKAIIDYGPHDLCFLDSESLEELLTPEDNASNIMDLNNHLYLERSDYQFASFNQLMKFSDFEDVVSDTDAPLVIWNDNIPKTTLADDEIIINGHLPWVFKEEMRLPDNHIMYDYFSPMKEVNKQASSNPQNPFDYLSYNQPSVIYNYLVLNNITIPEDFINDVDAYYSSPENSFLAHTITDDTYRVFYTCYLSEEYGNYFYSTGGGKITNAYDPSCSGNSIYQGEVVRILSSLDLFDKTYSFDDKDVKIVGFTHDPNNYTNNDVIVLSDSSAESYVISADDKLLYNFAMGAMPLSNLDSLTKVVSFSYNKGDSLYSLNNSVSVVLSSVNDMIEVLANVFLYIGIGFAVFASLMLMNFISISISNKKREIGILRAVGARKTDVFKIFFIESFIIAMINFVLAVIASIVVTTILNGVIRNDYGIQITFLNYGIRQVVLTFGICLLAAFIATFFPVIKIARKHPIDAINNR